ncbi:ATP-binding protein [Nocardia pneumoniae]|uniref:ATP-binding protein n=1 Tax=Nocardia pneumoniae TaxID=228601 RepID=UPI0002F18841|nr:ATP-binding protein [Nocardia pneumoniae]
MASGSRAASARMTASSMLDTPSHSRSLALGRFRPSCWRRGVVALSGEKTSEGAADRILRRLGLAIGIAGVIAAVVELPEIADQSRFVSVGWTVVEVVLAFGWFPVLAVVSIALGPRVIQLVAGAAAVSFLAAMAVVPFAYAEPAAEGAASVWLYRVLALGVLAAVLAWRPPFAVAYLMVGAAFSALANLAVLHETTALALLGDFARAAGLSALFLWCVIYARAAADRVDRESAIESSRAAAVAGAAARERERARFAALIHDAVLSTLLDASRAGTESPVLRRQAERTLEQLDECRVGDTEPDRLDAQSAIGFLRSAVHEVNPGIRFTARRWTGFDDLHLPVEAASTIAAALAEAARNSLRHATVAGREVVRTVTVTISAGGIRVVFRDDGAGFDLSEVPVDRLGISVSILGRMRQLAGGAGFVESQPGEGTTVTLVWGGNG